MLAREDLESLDWCVGDDGESFWVEALWGSPEGQESTAQARQLQSASPELALACLEAREVARRVAEHFRDTDAPLGVAARNLARALDSALSLAGVQHGD